jgi:hypothetical protein
MLPAGTRTSVNYVSITNVRDSVHQDIHLSSRFLVLVVGDHAAMHLRPRPCSLTVILSLHVVN